MDLSLIINIIVSLGAIPYLTNLIKKILPKTKRFAPVIVLVLAIIYVQIAKMLGINADLKSTFDALLLALGLGGTSALAYDALKVTVRNK